MMKKSWYCDGIFYFYQLPVTTDSISSEHVNLQKLQEKAKQGLTATAAPRRRRPGTRL